MAFKITQLAKDLGIKSKEITELMTARGMECKTTQKALTAGEFDIVFEVLTRAAQIKCIDDYLFGDTYIPTKAPEKKPKPEKAEAEAPKAEPEKKAEAPKADAPTVNVPVPIVSQACFASASVSAVAAL